MNYARQRSVSYTHLPQDIIRDPFVLEFAGLPKQKRYKEGDLEKALKDHMEQFLSLIHIFVVLEGFVQFFILRVDAVVFRHLANLFSRSFLSLIHI